MSMCHLVQLRNDFGATSKERRNDVIHVERAVVSSRALRGPHGLAKTCQGRAPHTMTGQPRGRATPPAAVLARPRRHRRRGRWLLRLRAQSPARLRPRPHPGHAAALRSCSCTRARSPMPPVVAACAVALASLVAHAARRATLHPDERRPAAS